MSEELLHLWYFLHVKMDVIEVFEETAVLEPAEIAFDVSPICFVNIFCICYSIFNDLWKFLEDVILQGNILLLF